MNKDLIKSVFSGAIAENTEVVLRFKSSKHSKVWTFNTESQGNKVVFLGLIPMIFRNFRRPWVATLEVDGQFRFAVCQREDQKLYESLDGITWLPQGEIDHGSK